MFMITYGKTNTHPNIKKASIPRTSRLCLRSRGVIAGHMKWYLSNMDELNVFDNYSLISAGVCINRYHSFYDKSKPVYRTCYFIFVGTVMLIQSNMFLCSFHEADVFVEHISFLIMIWLDSMSNQNYHYRPVRDEAASLLNICAWKEGMCWSVMIIEALVTVNEDFPEYIANPYRKRSHPVAHMPERYWLAYNGFPM